VGSGTGAVDDEFFGVEEESGTRAAGVFYISSANWPMGQAFSVLPEHLLRFVLRYRIAVSGESPIGFI
jgi:hypothetical protein